MFVAAQHLALAGRFLIVYNRRVAAVHIIHLLGLAVETSVAEGFKVFLTQKLTGDGIGNLRDNLIRRGVFARSRRGDAVKNSQEMVFGGGGDQSGRQALAQYVAHHDVQHMIIMRKEIHKNRRQSEFRLPSAPPLPAPA